MEFFSDQLARGARSMNSTQSNSFIVVVVVVQVRPICTCGPEIRYCVSPSFFAFEFCSHAANFVCVRGTFQSDRVFEKKSEKFLPSIAFVWRPITCAIIGGASQKACVVCVNKIRNRWAFVWFTRTIELNAKANQNARTINDKEQASERMAFY